MLKIKMIKQQQQTHSYLDGTSINSTSHRLCEFNLCYCTSITCTSHIYEYILHVMDSNVYTNLSPVYEIHPQIQNNNYKPKQNFKSICGLNTIFHSGLINDRRWFFCTASHSCFFLYLGIKTPI